MSVIDAVLAPANVDASAWAAEAFEAELLRASRVFEVKAALLDCLTAPTADARRPASSAGHITSHDPKLDDEPAVYGPAARRRLDARWRESALLVDDHLHEATGYGLEELRTCHAIERCMSTAANAPSAHPALYPALMKLYRLQTEEEKKP